MALQLSYDDKYGSTHKAAYHMVGSLRISRPRQVGIFVIWTYVDQAARAKGAKPLRRLEYILTGDDYEAVFGEKATSPAGANVVANIYGHLKKLEEWSDALDV